MKGTLSTAPASSLSEVSFPLAFDGVEGVGSLKVGLAGMLGSRILEESVGDPFVGPAGVSSALPCGKVVTCVVGPGASRFLPLTPACARPPSVFSLAGGSAPRRLFMDFSCICLWPGSATSLKNEAFVFCMTVIALVGEVLGAFFVSGLILGTVYSWSCLVPLALLQ